MAYLLRVILVYTCVTTVAVGTSSLSIEISPLYTVVASGAKTRLHCVVSSTLMSTTRWFTAESNVEISNDDKFNTLDNGTLEITGFSTNDDGLYYCIGSNSLGSVKSLEARIQIAYIDNVQSSYPKTLSFRPNQNLTLPCNTPDSIPTAEVVWYKETSEITSNERIGIAQDNSLVFSHCLDDDAGQWKCKVKNSLLSNEKESNSYLLQRGPDLQPTIQTAKFVFVPADKTVTSGNTLELQCIATGRPSPSYTWLKDGETLKENDRISFAQNSRILKINGAKITDSGNYSCRVNQEAISHTVVSDSASLVVKDPPSIISPLLDSISQKGSLSVSLVCTANGTLPITWNWFNDTLLIKESDKIEIQNTVTSTGSQSSVNIKDLSPEDGGVWQCVASNDETGADQSTQLLIVNTTYPVIIKKPTDVLAFVGDDVTLPFFCEAYPFPTFFWFEYYQLLSVASNPRYSVSDDSPFNGTLAITSVTVGDSGVFQARCSSFEGNQTSEGAIVTIINKPEVLSSPKTSLVSLGSQTTIHCKIEDLSNIEEEYHWSRDSNEVVESDRVFMYSNGSLHISNFTVSDLGYYDCTVTLTIASNAANPLRYAVGGAFITEDPPTRPSPPMISSVGSISSENAILEWTEPADNGGLHILGYILEITNHGRQDCTVENDQFNISSNSSTRQMMIPLTPYSRYSVALYAFNSLGNSKASERTDLFWTQEEVPSAAPDSVFARQGEVVGELFVQWKPPPCQERNGLIVNYTVTAHSSAGQVSVTTSSNLTSVILRQLRALEEYMVQVSAATTAGSGPLSLSFTAKTTLASVPDVPLNLRVSQVTLTSAHITWDPPIPRSNEPINGLTSVSHYQLSYGQVTLNITTTNFTVRDLQGGPGSMVEFKVSGFNSFGKGESTSLPVRLPNASNNNTTVTVPVNNNNGNTTEKIAFYQEEWFPYLAGGVGVGVALIALMICVVVCTVCYKCRWKGSKHNSSFQSTTSNHSFVYPNRKSTVLNKMMKVESMETSSAPEDTDSESQEGEETDGQDSTSVYTAMTTSQSSSTLRSKYKYRSPLEQEEYQQLSDLRQNGFVRGKAKTSQTMQINLNPESNSSTPLSSNSRSLRDASPTDTVSSFEYQSQSRLQLAKKRRPSYTTDGYDTSSEDESIIHRVNPLTPKQLGHSVTQNGILRKHGAKGLPNLAKLTALPQNNMPPYMPTAIPVNGQTPDLIHRSYPTPPQQLSHFPKSWSNSSEKSSQISGIDRRQATFV